MERDVMLQDALIVGIKTVLDGSSSGTVTAMYTSLLIES